MNKHENIVLFVCTGNAGRSQIAEELFRRMAPEDIVVRSGGVEPWPNVHPMAVKLLAERGIDVAQKKPRHAGSYLEDAPALVVTIGDPARDKTPDYPGHPVRVHWDIGDPADTDGTADSETVFRRAFSAIEERLGGLLEVVEKSVPDVPPFSPGISTCVVRPARFEPAEHLPLLARAGFTCIELNCHQGEKDFDWKSPRSVQDLLFVSRSEGIRIRSVHAPGQYPRTNIDEATGRDYVDTTKMFCDIAAEVGARVLVIHALKPAEESQAWDDQMRRLLDELAEYVLPLPVVLGFENLTWRVDPSEDLALIRCYSADAMCFVLDNGHSHLFDASDDYLNLCGLRLCSLHIQDNNGMNDAHAVPGEGNVDWERFMRQLVRTGYTGPLMLEAENHERPHDLPGYLDECTRSVRMLQEYLPEGLRP